MRPAAAETKRFACLDGYRGIAATAVLVTHVSFITAANREVVVGAYLARLDVGVAVFFVLSGFLRFVSAAAGSCASSLRTGWPSPLRSCSYPPLTDLGSSTPPATQR
jgi:peptidoglycan/LPS O-acetylase OafA/YrhL